VRVKVMVQGHHYYDEFEGDVLMWGQMVSRMGGAFLQVPGVLVKRDDGQIVQVPLQAELREITVEEVSA